MKIGLTYESKAALKNESQVADDLLEAEEDYTIAELADAIRKSGHEVTLIGSAPDLLAMGRAAVADLDLVFNYAVGFRGRARETWVPAILDVLGIPYVGSDALTL